MKKNYTKPELELVRVTFVSSLLTGSPTFVRNADGDPVTPGEGKSISSGIQETDGVLDPYSNMGANGNSNRAKGGLWDAWDD